MDTVMNKLSEIEAAANKIMTDANEQKKEMTTAMEKKTQEFDAAVEKETSLKLEEIRTTLKADMAKELTDLQQHTQDTLTAINQNFEQNHDVIATKIYEKIIRM